MYTRVPESIFHLAIIDYFSDLKELWGSIEFGGYTWSTSVVDRFPQEPIAISSAFVGEVTANTTETLTHPSRSLQSTLGATVEPMI